MMLLQLDADAVPYGALFVTPAVAGATFGTTAQIS